MTRPLERPYLLDGVEYVEILDGAGHYLDLPSLTTTQRDALTPDNGMMIYNSTTAQIEAYQNGSWGAVSGGSQTPWASDIDAAGYDLSDLGKLNFDDATTLTIATGVITITQSYHSVDTEALAATDDLDTISGGTAGDLIYLKAADGTRTVVLKHGTGNIVTPDGNDYSLDDANKLVALVFDGTNWHLVGSAAAGGATTFLGLTDTPSAYTGYAGYVPGVTSAETGVEWVKRASITTATMDVYVATTGSDTTGDGSSTNPYLTIQHAIDTLPDLLAHAVTIHVADGTYRELVSVRNKYLTTPSASLTIEGNTTDPTLCRVTGSDAAADTTPARKQVFLITNCPGVTLNGFQVDYGGADVAGDGERTNIYIQDSTVYLKNIYSQNGTSPGGGASLWGRSSAIFLGDGPDTDTNICKFNTSSGAAAGVYLLDCFVEGGATEIKDHTGTSTRGLYLQTSFAKIKGTATLDSFITGNGTIGARLAFGSDLTLVYADIGGNGTYGVSAELDSFAWLVYMTVSTANTTADLIAQNHGMIQHISDDVVLSESVGNVDRDDIW